MSSAAAIPTPLSSQLGGPVLLHGVTWERYEALIELLGDEHPSLRLTYLEGTLEVMTSAPEHERIKKLLARLLELIVPYRLVGEAYERRDTSELLPGLDLDQLSGFIRDAVDQTSAAQAYRLALRASTR